MPLNIEKAKLIQLQLAKKVEFRKVEKIEKVAGLDVAYRKGLAYGAVVVIDVETKEVVDAACVIVKDVVPYVPTYLAFREITPSIRAYLKLREEPDVIMVDGHGIAHPRRFGIAAHIGVVLKKPTIGVAKSLLYGLEIDNAVLDPNSREVLARVIYCRGKKYVSVGSYITLEEAVELTERLCTREGVLPLTLAHRTTQRLKNISISKFDQWGEALANHEDWHTCSRHHGLRNRPQH